MKIRKMGKITLGLALIVLGASCATASGKKEASPAERQGANPAENRITVDIVPGEHYSHRKWFFLFPVKLTPTMAVWAEDEGGRFAGTLYVTKKAAEGSWTGAKERPEALPVYFARLQAAAGKADSVSGATPGAGEAVSLGSDLNLSPGTYRIFAEVNSSFDYNDTFPEAVTGVNGQPSLVYSGRLTAGAGPEKTDLVPIGTGDPAGKNGIVTEGTPGLTTALGIVERIGVAIRD
jgi:hypothetical protein